MKRLALVTGAVLVAVFGFAAPAAAHVTVNPQEATQGGYARLAFRVAGPWRSRSAPSARPSRSTAAR
jgi:uncharacterized protein YcnI